MEIKAELNKPYSEDQRLDFIITYNHNQGFEIRESATALEAWGYTEEEKEEQEQERIKALSMTRSDFFDGMIMAFGLDSEDLLTVIESILQTLPIQEVDKKIAVNNYKNALNFYRKHTLFTLLSDVEIPVSEMQTLLITSKQWDKFFDETAKKNPEAYKELLPQAEE